MPLCGQPTTRLQRSAEVTDRVPVAVRRYLARALPTSWAARQPAKQVRITQTGEMWSKPGGRAMRFIADERFAVDRVGFCWEARFPLGPLFAIHVRDWYADGKGLLRVRALGIPIQRRSGHDVAVGEAYRYLAELPWVPHAMATNQQLEWQHIDDRRVAVSSRVDRERLTVLGRNPAHTRLDTDDREAPAVLGPATPDRSFRGRHRLDRHRAAGGRRLCDRVARSGGLHRAQTRSRPTAIGNPPIPG
jgi:hypothetical protein